MKNQEGFPASGMKDSVDNKKLESMRKRKDFKIFSMDDITSEDLTIDEESVALESREEILKDQKEQILVQEIINECEGVKRYVDNYYDNSTIKDNRDQLENFKEHNNQVVKLALEEGVKRNLPREKLKLLGTAAYLHDLKKGDQVLDERNEIGGDFMLVYHGEAAALELEENEELQNLIKKNLGEENFEENKKNLQAAFRSHMGPNPGFMKEKLDKVNEKIKELNSKIKDKKNHFKEVSHPYPEEGDEISEILLMADMYSLSSPKGVGKILQLRSIVPDFIEEDIALSSEYAEYKIPLSMGEAALISVMKSGISARDMMRSEEEKEYIQEAINRSKRERSFKYKTEGGGEMEVNFENIKGKIKAYEEAKGQQYAAREKIGRAA